MSIPLTFQDILYAALFAIPVTWLITTVSQLFKTFANQAAEFSYLPKHQETVLKRCYLLFPNEHLRIKGELFTRGMAVHVVTLQKRIIEGTLVGSNDENMFCVITESRVVAQEVDNVEEMRLAEG